ncbi:MAG: apolipoprotein N-acyltransferase [Nitrospirae bacterium]|nr:apolipoprotein N-acyltransferase [Nitrospirota bacterium]
MKGIFKDLSKRDIILSILSGILVSLSFPTPDLWPLAWISLVPLFISLKGKSKRSPFTLGLLAGFFYFLITVSWVVNSMYNYGKVPLPVSYLIMLMLVLYLALYIGLFSFLRGLFVSSGQTVVIVSPLIWTALEFIRAHIFTGFPWVLLGYSQYRFLPIIQISDVTSVYGVSFLIVMVNEAVAWVIMTIMERRQVRVSLKGAWPVYLAGSLFILVLFYGYYRLGEDIGKAGKKLKVALLQGNIEQDKKWDERYRLETIEIYKRLTRDAVDSGAGIIVWPESATPFFFLREAAYREELRRLALDNRVYLLFGSPDIREKNNKIELLNSAFLLSPEGTLASRYDKIHLVPFGEYVPLSKILFFIDKMVVGIGDFVPGDKYTVMEAGDGKLGVVICFEVIFPDLVRRFVSNGAEYMTTITNDAWFGASSAPYQHFSMVVFRSVENRVPFVRAANTGISGSIDAYGRIRKSTDIFVEDKVVDEIVLRDRTTIYTRYGDIFAYLCVIMTALLMIYRRIYVSRL